MTMSATVEETGRIGGRKRFRLPLSLSGTVGLVLVVVVVTAIVVGPFVWRGDPSAQSLIHALEGPSLRHPLGTDQQGRDLLSRILAGGSVSLFIGFASMMIGLIAGTVIGISAGLTGGAFRAALLRLVDALLSVPGIVQAVILVAVAGQGIMPLVIALGIYSTPIFARVAYSATRQIRNEAYFLAAKTLGAGPLRIIGFHILPNIATPLITIATLRIGANILTGAALNFFGLGVQPPAPEWGLMIADARAYSWSNPMILFYPGICLFATSLGFNLLGDGLRDWLDPHSRGTR